MKLYDKVGANEEVTQLTYKALCRWSRIRAEGASTSVQYILHKVSTKDAGIHRALKQWEILI